MLVGDLVVRMAADIADLRAGFNEAKDTMSRFADQADRSIGIVKTALFSLSTGYSLLESIRQTEEYGSQLQRLQDITGLAAAEVQKLSLVAKLNDTDAGALTKSWGKLVTQLVDVSSEGDKTRAIIQALGVQAFDPLTGKVKPANDLMAALAGSFNNIADPATKAKLASELFGKTYQDMLVIFKNWDADGQRVQETLDRIGAASDGSTANADRLGDTLTLMAETTKARLLPAMGDLADLLDRARLLMLPAKEETSLFSQALSALAFVANAVLDSLQAVYGVLRTMVQPIVAIIETAGAAAKALARGEGLAGAADAAGEAFRNSKTMVEVYQQGVDNLNGSLKTSKIATLDETAAAIAAGEAYVDNGDKALKAAAALKAQEEARKAAAAAAKKEAEELDKLSAKYEQMLRADQAGLATNTIQQLDEVSRLLDKGRINWETYNALIGEILDKDPVLAQEQKEINKSLDDMAKLVDQVREARAKELFSIDDQIAAQVKANATFGLGKTAVVDYTIAELQRQQADAAGIPGEEAAIDQLQRRIDKLYVLRDAVSMGEALDAQKRALEEAGKAWDKFIGDVGQAFGNFISDWVDNGASAAFHNLWDNFKKWALQALAEIAAKQIVVSVVGAVSTTGAAAGGLIPGIGGGGGLSDIFSNLGMAGERLLNDFSTVGSAIGSFGSTLLDTGSIVDAFSSATSIAGLSLSSVVPVVGAVVAAGTLIYNWLDSKRGGPKQGGFATTGDTPGIFGTDGSGRWFTPSGSDPEMVKAVAGIQAQYNALVKALGGSGSAVFAQGFSTDPNGTAPSNVHTGAWVNGTQVFNNPNGNVGRSSEELQAELSTQSMRAILAALQASELPTVIHDYLASIDVSTATVEQISAALSHAADLKVLVDQVSALPEDMANGLLGALGASDEIDAQIAAFAAQFHEFSLAAGALQDQLDRDPKAEAMKAVAAAHATTYEKVGLARDALQDLMGKYDGSTDGTKALTAATQAYVDAQVQALIQIQQVRDGLSSMFGDTIRNMDLALMNTEQQKNFYINEALTTQQLLEKTTDPAEIERLSRIINEDVTRAFSLMDPAEQQKQHDYLNGILTTAQSTADKQLDLAHDAVVQAGTDSQTILDNVQTLLDAAANKQMEAAERLIDAANAVRDAANQNAAAAEKNSTAATQQTVAAATNAAAATTMVQAANTPVKVEISYNDGSGP